MGHTPYDEEIIVDIVAAIGFTSGENYFPAEYPKPAKVSEGEGYAVC